MKPEMRFKYVSIFANKNDYEIHKKKLEELSTRKSEFINTQRITKLEAIKNRKQNTFLKQIQTRNHIIDKNNIKIIQKLASPLEKRISETNLDKLKITKDINPFRKKQLYQMQKQNLRMREKIKSLSSSINTKKIVQQYQRTQMIKNRIRKYDGNSLQGSRKILIKIQKNLSSTQLPKSNSEKSLKKDESIISKRNQTILNKLKINEQKLQQGFKSTIYNSKSERKYNTFYNKDQILKNKLNLKDQFQLQRRRKLSIIYRMNIRPLTQNIQTLQNDGYQIFDNKQKIIAPPHQQQIKNNRSFFSTQINKKLYKTISKQK